MIHTVCSLCRSLNAHGYNHTREREIHAINKWSDQLRDDFGHNPYIFRVQREQPQIKNIGFVNLLYLFTQSRETFYILPMCVIVHLIQSATPQKYACEIICDHWQSLFVRFVAVRMSKTGENIENLSFINRFEMLCQTKLRLNDKTNDNNKYHLKQYDEEKKEVHAFSQQQGTWRIETENGWCTLAAFTWCALCDNYFNRIIIKT